MSEQLERERGGRVVGMPSWLADRQCLAADLEVMPVTGILLVEFCQKPAGLHRLPRGLHDSYMQ